MGPKIRFKKFLRLMSAMLYFRLKAGADGNAETLEVDQGRKQRINKQERSYVENYEQDRGKRNSPTSRQPIKASGRPIACHCMARVLEWVGAVVDLVGHGLDGVVLLDCGINMYEWG